MHYLLLNMESLQTISAETRVILHDNLTTWRLDHAFWFDPPHHGEDRGVTNWYLCPFLPVRIRCVYVTSSVTIHHWAASRTCDWLQGMGEFTIAKDNRSN